MMTGLGQIRFRSATRVTFFLRPGKPYHHFSSRFKPGDAQLWDLVELWRVERLEREIDNQGCVEF